MNTADRITSARSDLGAALSRSQDGDDEDIINRIKAADDALMGTDDAVRAMLAALDALLAIAPVNAEDEDDPEAAAAWRQAKAAVSSAKGGADA